MAVAQRLGLGEEQRQKQDPRFEPPWTTVQVGMIEGGTALNILPGECSFLWEYRNLPSEDPRGIRSRFEHYAETEVLPRLREFAPEAAIETEKLAVVPPLAPEQEGAAEALVRRLTGSNEVVLVDEERAAGRYEVGFDARDLAAGVYLARLHAGASSAVQRLTVVR